MHFFRKYVPGCEKATLMGTGSVMGIRESRHVHGDFVLPVQDLIDGVIPEDNILLSANSIDVHGAMGGPAGGLYMPAPGTGGRIPQRRLDLHERQYSFERRHHSERLQDLQT